MGAALKNEEVKKIWDDLRGVEFSNDILEGFANKKKVDSDKLKSTYNVMKKIANHSTLEEFQNFITDQEIPAVKLTDKEMNAIKGGWFIFEFWDFLPSQNKYSKLYG